MAVIQHSTHPLHVYFAAAVVASARLEQRRIEMDGVFEAAAYLTLVVPANTIATQRARV
jgi:hypothetical protein